MDAREASIAYPLLLAAASFKIDQVTAEVSTALREDGIPSVLLKGPGIANWLYSSDDPRFYNDSDLLLRKSDWDRALEMMAELGFEDDLGPLEHPRMESGAGYPWIRKADGAAVDLHFTLFGIGADPEILWEALAADSELEAVGGIKLQIPSRPARLLHIALHAVQHGGETWAKPIKDLEHALERAGQEMWSEALGLAKRLDADDAFAAGLRLRPRGIEIADAIGAEQKTTTHVTLRLDSVPTAEGFQELFETQGAHAKAAIAFRELFPNREFMRWWSPMANRGRLGLLIAYLWRPIWLAWRAVPGFLAWRRASRK